MSEDCETPPLATAAKSLKDDGEMFRVMGELIEIPWLFKFERLRTLLCWEYNPPWVKEEFKKLLSTMPVDKVTSKNTVKPKFEQGEQFMRESFWNPAANSYL